MSRNSYEVPGAERAMEQLKKDVMVREGFVSPDSTSENVKYEVARKLGIPLHRGDNGDLTTKQAGKVGGKIGGSMIKEMVRLAQQQMAGKNKTQ